jgi:hypothetical protein
VIRLRPRDRPQLILHGGDALGVVGTAPLGAAETFTLGMRPWREPLRSGGTAVPKTADQADQECAR